MGLQRHGRKVNKMEEMEERENTREERNKRREGSSTLVRMVVEPVVSHLRHFSGEADRAGSSSVRSFPCDARKQIVFLFV